MGRHSIDTLYELGFAVSTFQPIIHAAQEVGREFLARVESVSVEAQPMLLEAFVDIWVKRSGFVHLWSVFEAFCGVFRLFVDILADDVSAIHGDEDGPIPLPVIFPVGDVLDVSVNFFGAAIRWGSEAVEVDVVVGGSFATHFHAEGLSDVFPQLRRCATQGGKDVLEF